MKPKQSLANKVRFFTAEDYHELSQAYCSKENEHKVVDPILLAECGKIAARISQAKLEREGKVVINHIGNNLWLEDVFDSPGFKPVPDMHKALLINPEPIE